jgi:hypothetical protein
MWATSGNRIDRVLQALADASTWLLFKSNGVRW